MCLTSQGWALSQSPDPTVVAPVQEDYKTRAIQNLGTLHYLGSHWTEPIFRFTYQEYKTKRIPTSIKQPQIIIVTTLVQQSSHRRGKDTILLPQFALFFF